MQALIDFEGWRKWRGYADSPNISIHNNVSKSGSNSSPPPPPRDNAVQAFRVSNLKNGSKFPDSSGSGSSDSRDDITIVPRVSSPIHMGENGF